MPGVGVLARFVIFSVTWSVVFGCSCFPQHPQSEYCSSKFVFYGKVVKERVIKGPPEDVANNEMVRRYKVQILYKMKGIGGKINSYTTIEAPGNSAMCGMTLTVGQSYVLMGYKSGGKKTINSCGFVRVASSLTFEQIFYLFSRGPYSYHKNCKSGCTKIDMNSKYCFLPQHDFSTMHCLSSKAVCMMSDGICGWANHEECSISTTPIRDSTIPITLPFSPRE